MSRLSKEEQKDLDKADAKAEAKAAEHPKPPTAREKLSDLQAHIQRLKGQLAAGSKSDLDAIGHRLDELSAKVQDVLSLIPEGK